MLQGVDKDPERAVRLWGEAADLGEAAAAYNLGLAYLYGTGIRHSILDARRWLERAATAGHKLAMMQLGEVFEYRLNRVPDALYWYKAAGEAGLPDGRDSFTRLMKVFDGETPGMEPPLHEL